MRASIPAVLLVLSAATASCGGSSYGYGSGTTTPCTASIATATTAVSLHGMEFVPSCVKISPGATIVFTNADSVPHTVTTDPSQPESFDSGPFGTGMTFSHQFAVAAETVHVHCAIHTYMTATILVE